MAKLLALLLLAMASQTLGDVTAGTKLISTFLVFRHGDRTPFKSSLIYSTNAEALEAVSAKYGFGQLTDLGKQRSYELGKFIRSRYGSLLSPQYNISEIYIRSTDTTRAKMTVLTAMSAVYPAYSGSWSKEINWVPTPYTTVPVKYDFNMAALNCPALVNDFQTVMTPDNSRMSKFFNVLNAISEQIGQNITATPAFAYFAYDVFTSQEHLGVPLSDSIASMSAEIKDAADVAVDILFGSEKFKEFQGGPFLDNFFTYTAKQIAGLHTPRVRIYSGHDTNVYSSMAVSKITPLQGVPKYNSAFALELRQVENTEKYVVLPVYQPSPGEDLVYLPVSGCDSLLCPYESFKEIVSSYVLDESTWRSKCGNNDDLKIDDSIVT